METNDPRLPESNPDEQPQEELDELQQKVRAYPEKQWVLIQRIAGGALGLLCGFLLTYFGALESTGMIATIGAALIALFVPKMVEKRVKRSIQKGRVMLMIALGVWLVAFALYMLIVGVPLVSKPA